MPTITQRLMLLAAAIVGVWFAALAQGPLRLADGSTGVILSLSIYGATPAWLTLLGLTLAVAPLAWWVSSTGSVLSGPTVLALAYLGLRSGLGPVDPKLWHGAPRELFGRWVVEGLGWSALIVCVGLAATAGRTWLRPRAPRRLRSPTCDPGTGLEIGALRGWVAAAAIAVTGLLVSAVLVRTPTSGQTWLGLMTGFGVVAALMQAGARSPNVLPMLAAPSLGLAIGHGWAVVRYGSWTRDELLAEHFIGRAPAILWASPADAASAGLLGVCLGLGVAHVAIAPNRGPRVAA
ncbi:MAG: hypothetical protein AAF288_09260 [Planctomycetota bacterium]